MERGGFGVVENPDAWMRVVAKRLEVQAIRERTRERVAWERERRQLGGAIDFRDGTHPPRTYTPIEQTVSAYQERRRAQGRAAQRRYAARKKAA